MTIEELELQVQKNTAAIASISNNLGMYATNVDLNAAKKQITSNNEDIAVIQTLINQINTSISLINKLAKLIDVNIQDVQKDDILQWDGNRWTNNSPAYIFGSQAVEMRLESLTDVNISNKADKQSLCWDNTSGKWINYTINGGGSGGSGVDLDAVWADLKKYDPSKTIDKSHITDFVLKENGTANNLTVNVLTATGLTTLSNGNTSLTVLSSGLTAGGNLQATGELTAYA